MTPPKSDPNQPLKWAMRNLDTLWGAFIRADVGLKDVTPPNPKVGTGSEIDDGWMTFLLLTLAFHTTRSSVLLACETRIVGQSLCQLPQPKSELPCEAVRMLGALRQITRA